MKGRNEFLVGLVLLLTLVVVVAGALWLSESDIGRRESLHVARFRTVGGLTPGAPVTYRGVRVGRVEAIRLADQFVEADLRVYQGVELPGRPAVIAASQSLFGEWGATIISRDQPQDDPNVRLMLAETSRPGGDRWPGATLPDVGQLTATAGRIAEDMAHVARRFDFAFDDTAAFGDPKDNLLPARFLAGAHRWPPATPSRPPPAAPRAPCVILPVPHRCYLFA